MEKSMRVSVHENAWTTGGAAYVAGRRLNEAIRAVAEKLDAPRNDQGSGPSAAELKDLRDRYLEHRALEEESQRLWDLLRWWWMPIAMGLALLLYRLILLTAAIVFLYGVAASALTT